MAGVVGVTHLMETAFAWIVGVTGGVYGYRRAWWWLCVVASWADDFRNERPFAKSDNEAFWNSREAVISTLRHLINLRLAEVDWRGIAGGLLLTLRHWRDVVRFTWRGLVRDTRVAWANIKKVFHVKPSIHPDTMATLANLDNAKLADVEPDARALLIAKNIEGLHLRLKVLGDKPPEQRTKDEIYEHEHIKAQLGEHYTPTAVQPLLGVPAVASLSLTPWIAGGFIGLVGLLGAQTWRLDRVKAENDDLRAFKTAAVDANKQWATWGKRASARIETMTVECLNEIDSARLAKQKAEQAAATERRRRLDVQKATIGGGGDVSLGDILRQLPGAGDPAAAADAVAANPSGLR